MPVLFENPLCFCSPGPMRLTSGSQVLRTRGRARERLEKRRFRGYQSLQLHSDGRDADAAARGRRGGRRARDQNLRDRRGL